VKLIDVIGKIFGGVMPEDMAGALQRFLDDELLGWDWDDHFGTPSMHPVVRRAKKELYAMGFDIPPDERWRTDPALRLRLESVIERLKAGVASGP